jgi:hypothetical protein
MKPQTICKTANPIMTRGLICLTFLLCFNAAPHIAQTGSKTARPGINVLAPQLSELDTATPQANGLPGTYTWHYGKITGIGDFSQAGGHEVVILWDQGGASRKQGGISDAEWEIFKLAFSGSGRVAVLSDLVTGWQFDYRFLEAQR